MYVCRVCSEYPTYIATRSEWQDTCDSIHL